MAYEGGLRVQGLGKDGSLEPLGPKGYSTPPLLPWGIQKHPEESSLGVLTVNSRYVEAVLGGRSLPHSQWGTGAHQVSR